MNKQFYQYLNDQIQSIKDAGTYKKERIITSQQSPEIDLADGSHVINFCANNLSLIHI